jgi:hypothetical protein
LQEARPFLLASGWTEAELDGFDVTNNDKLDSIIATGQTVDQLIDEGRVRWQPVGEGGLIALDSMGRPVGSANPARGAVAPTAAPALAPAEAAGTVASTLAASMPPHVVAGFLGNFEAEGGYSGAKGDGGTASGIAQWRGERQANFQRVIGKPVDQATPEEQAKFVLWEMQNPEQAFVPRKGLTPVQQRDAILNASSPAEAAELIDRFYERSSGQHRAARVAAANRFAGVDGAVRVASKAEFDRLPSGTAFIAPDGSRRRKP